MKIRSGFVSNSSSSSFIVAFPKKPENVEEVKALLFPNGQEAYGCYDYHCSTQIVAETVWKDIQSQKPDDKEIIWKELHGYLEGGPNSNWSEFKTADGDINWEALNIERCKYRQKVMKKFTEENSDKTIYCFHYSDDNGSYEEALEHGGLFNYLPHITVSHH
jgi:hypothetical protein